MAASRDDWEKRQNEGESVDLAWPSPLAPAVLCDINNSHFSLSHKPYIRWQKDHSF